MAIPSSRSGDRAPAATVLMTHPYHCYAEALSTEGLRLTACPTYPSRLWKAVICIFLLAEMGCTHVGCFGHLWNAFKKYYNLFIWVCLEAKTQKLLKKQQRKPLAKTLKFMQQKNTKEKLGQKKSLAYIMSLWTDPDNRLYTALLLQTGLYVIYANAANV